MSWTLELCVREVCVCVWSVRHAGARMHDLCCMFVCVAGALTLAAVALRVFVCMRMLCYSSRG